MGVMQMLPRGQAPMSNDPFEAMVAGMVLLSNGSDGAQPSVLGELVKTWAEPFILLPTRMRLWEIFNFDLGIVLCTATPHVIMRHVMSELDLGVRRHIL